MERGREREGLAFLPDIRSGPDYYENITFYFSDIVNRYWSKRAALSDELIIDLMREKLANEWTTWKKTREGKKWLEKNND